MSRHIKRHLSLSQCLRLSFSSVVNSLTRRCPRPLLRLPYSRFAFIRAVVTSPVFPYLLQISTPWCSSQCMLDLFSSLSASFPHLFPYPPLSLNAHILHAARHSSPIHQTCRALNLAVNADTESASFLWLLFILRDFGLPESRILELRKTFPLRRLYIALCTLLFTLDHSISSSESILCLYDFHPKVPTRFLCIF